MKSRTLKKIGRILQAVIDFPYFKPKPRAPTAITEVTDGSICSQCGQPCSKREFEMGFCEDCDQVDFDDEFP